MTYVLDTRTANDRFPGIGRYVLNLARELGQVLDEGESLILLRDKTSLSSSVDQILTNARVRKFAVSSSPFSIQQQWSLPRSLQRLGATLYHSTYYMMPYRPKVRTVLTIYDLIPVTYPGSVSLQARLVFRPATRLAIRAASHIITISEATRQHLLELYPVDPGIVTTIPLAADETFRPQDADTIRRIRHRHNLPKSYGLYLGTNKPHKNLVRLVEAWFMVVRQWPGPAPSPMLVVAGPWDNRYDAPTRRVSQLSLDGQVRFLGPIPEPELPGLLAGADVFVFPSLMEGFGLPVLEAMSCGTPVVCARISSLREVASEAALYFDPEDIEDCASVMTKVLANSGLRAELSQRGLSRAAKFSWRGTAQETVQIYRALVDRAID